MFVLQACVTFLLYKKIPPRSFKTYNTQLLLYILDYVKEVDGDEYNHVECELDEIERIWAKKASSHEKLEYKNAIRKDPSTGKVKVIDGLFDPDYKENSRFRILNTMRSVETIVKVSIKE